MPSIAELSVNCIYIQVINLHENQIKNNGVALIIRKCKNHNEIKVLDLGWNLIGNRVFNLIFKDELIAQHRLNLPKLQKKEENDKQKIIKKIRSPKKMQVMILMLYTIMLKWLNYYNILLKITPLKLIYQEKIIRKTENQPICN